MVEGTGVVVLDGHNQCGPLVPDRVVGRGVHIGRAVDGQGRAPVPVPRSCLEQLPHGQHSVKDVVQAGLVRLPAGEGLEIG